jgi:hypothetical protein
MNFASHYYFQSTSSELYNAGLILADLIPLAQATPFPLLPAVKNVLVRKDIDSDAENIFNGILDHIEADRIFHRSQFFRYSIDRSIEVSKKNSPINNIMQHVLVELCMDRYMLQTDRNMIVRMYESFEQSYQYACLTLKEFIPIDEQTEYFSKRFCENKTILRYDDFSVIVRTLSGIGSNIGISFPLESGRTIELIYHELEGSIAAYFANAKGIYRKISKTLP